MIQSPQKATPHQLALKAKHKLSDREFTQMLEMLRKLTASERRGLENPDFITEDEADMIVINRRRSERTVPAEDVLAEFGHAPHPRV